MSLLPEPALRILLLVNSYLVDGLFANDSMSSNRSIFINYLII